MMGSYISHSPRASCWHPHADNLETQLLCRAQMIETAARAQESCTLHQRKTHLVSYAMRRVVK